jgi:hypothetical protein
MELNCFKMLYYIFCERNGAEKLRSQSILSPVLLRYTMVLWHMGPRQSLSEVVGTHVVLDCKWIITVFLHTIPLPSPSPHPNQCCSNQNTSNMTRNGTQHSTGGEVGDWRFVEIQRFCCICPNTFETDCNRTSNWHLCIIKYNLCFLCFLLQWQWRNGPFWISGKDRIDGAIL